MCTTIGNAKIEDLNTMDPLQERLFPGTHSEYRILVKSWAIPLLGTLLRPLERKYSRISESMVDVLYGQDELDVESKITLVKDSVASLVAEREQVLTYAKFMTCLKEKFH